MHQYPSPTSCRAAKQSRVPTWQMMKTSGPPLTRRRAAEQSQVPTWQVMMTLWHIRQAVAEQQSRAM